MDKNVCSLMFFVLIYSQCHLTDSSAFTISATKNNACVQSFTTMLELFDLFSGYINADHKIAVHDHCKQDSAYFIAKYDCVLHNPNEDLDFDHDCTYYGSGKKINIVSSNFPSENITKTGYGSCSCSAMVTGSQMVLKTYDNRLIHNQSFMLTYENKTLIKEWKKVNKMEDIMNIKYIDRPFTGTHLMLKWTNNAASNGGKLWIVLEVNGTINVTCQHHKATTASLPTTTSMSSSILTSLNSSPWNSSPVTSAGQSNKSSSSIPASMQSQNGTCNEPKNASDRRVNIIKLLAGVAGGHFVFIILMCCCVLIRSKKRSKTEPERQPANESLQNQY